MKLLQFFVSFAAVALAQSVDPNKVFDQIKAGRDIAKLWSSFSIAPSPAFECHDGCDAQFIEHEFDPEFGQGRTSILLVTGNFIAFHRILLFHCEPACSYIDHIEQSAHYMDVEVSVATARERRWLVVTGNTGSGSGLSSYGSEWYELRSHKLHHVLTVPHHGFMAESDPATTTSMRFVRYASANQNETLDFAYHVEFGGGRPRLPPYEPGPHFLWDEEWTVTFSRSEPDLEYTLDRSRSTIPANWNRGDLVQGPGLDKILPYATDLLLKIARDSKEPRRAWLKPWIQTAGDSREAQQIRAALKASER